MNSCRHSVARSAPRAGHRAGDGRARRRGATGPDRCAPVPARAAPARLRAYPAVRRRSRWPLPRGCAAAPAARPPPRCGARTLRPANGAQRARHGCHRRRSGRLWPRPGPGRACR
ncbi:hypothetical protein G6F58_012883 [Rhizopus delemar]|nr:hypothetical protein G6F58_012883 [Rhizopus delemar]